MKILFTISLFLCPFSFVLAEPKGLNGDMEQISETAKGMSKYLIRQIRDGSDFGPGPVAYTPAGWGINIGMAKFWSVDAAELPEEKPNVHGGTASMYVFAKKATHIHNQNCQLEPGTYRFAVWTKGQGSVSLITYNYKDPYHYAGCGRVLMTAQGTNSWTRTEVVAEIGHEKEGTTYSVPTLMFPAGADLYIDDLTIESVASRP